MLTRTYANVLLLCHLIETQNIIFSGPEEWQLPIFKKGTLFGNVLYSLISEELKLTEVVFHLGFHAGYRAGIHMRAVE